MAADIIINQASKPAGVAGKAREDLDVGTNVSLTASGGPFLAHLWEIVDKPVDIEAGSQSSALLSAPTSATTLVTPVDLAGTYLVSLTVDSGSGLGALPDDVAHLTFYANDPSNPLATDPAELPRREIAFRETTEHNVDDAVFPTGNIRGWAQERQRWDALLRRMYLGKSFAWGRVVLTGGGAALVDATLGGFNVASVTRVSTGVVDVAFTRAAANTDYAVVPTARGPIGGSAVVDSETVNGFRLYRGNPGGTLVDADFSFVVKHRPF